MTGVIIALDRCERGLTNESTLAEIKAQGIDVYSIITLFDLIDYLKATNQNEHVKKPRIVPSNLWVLNFKERFLFRARSRK